jgi:hypothetical protein
MDWMLSPRAREPHWLGGDLAEGSSRVRWMAYDQNSGPMTVEVLVPFALSLDACWSRVEDLDAGWSRLEGSPHRLRTV